MEFKSLPHPGGGDGGGEVPWAKHVVMESTRSQRHGNCVLGVAITMELWQIFLALQGRTKEKEKIQCLYENADIFSIFLLQTYPIFLQLRIITWPLDHVSRITYQIEHNQDKVGLITPE